MYVCRPLYVCMYEWRVDNNAVESKSNCSLTTLKSIITTSLRIISLASLFNASTYAVQLMGYII